MSNSILNKDEGPSRVFAKGYKDLLELPIGTDFANHEIDGFSLSAENLDKHAQIGVETSSPFGDQIYLAFVRVQQAMECQNKLAKLVRDCQVTPLMAAFMRQLPVDQVYKANEALNFIDKSRNNRLIKQTLPSKTVMIFDKARSVANTNTKPTGKISLSDLAVEVLEELGAPLPLRLVG